MTPNNCKVQKPVHSIVEFDTWKVVQAFKNAMVKEGLTPPDRIEPRVMIRFSDNSAKKNKNAWCALFINPDGSAGGAYGSWRDGWQEKWFFKPEDMNTIQRKVMDKHIDVSTEKAKAEQSLSQKKAAETAVRIWHGSSPADPNHGYLEQKLINPYGLKQTGKALLVPIWDEQGAICSLQFIYPNGQKRFLKDGRTKGCYVVIGDMSLSETFLCCEGYATGATLNEASKKPVVVSFNSANLPRVAHFFKEKNPDKNQIICADNDLTTEKKSGRNPGKEAGEKAASSTGATLCLCPIDSDFNDLAVCRGIQAVRNILTKAIDTIPPEWDAIIPLEDGQARGMTYDMFPGIFGKMCQAVSESTETPLELSVGIMLAVVATACHRKMIIKIKTDYDEPLNIWTVTALNPANRKSSVLTMITKPLSEWEDHKMVEMKPMIHAAESRLKNHEARLKTLRQRYGNAKPDDCEKILSEIGQIESQNEVDKSLVYPRVWAQDITPEQLGVLLNEHDEAMSILSSEGGIFDIVGGRYSNGIPNLDLFLQAHAGDPVRVDRGSRGPVQLHSPALTLGLSPQPEVLRGLADKKGFRGKGLLARFLYLLPQSRLGKRKLETEPVPEDLKREFYDIIHRLLDIKPDKDAHGGLHLLTLRLSSEAYRIWGNFFNSVEKELPEGGKFEHISDWAGKLPGAAARIAGLFHCSENPNQPWTIPVASESMKKAIEVALVYAEHALLAFGLMGADPALDGARKVWRWIKRMRYSTFSKRDCFNALKGTFHRVSDIEEPLKILKERNYINEDTVQTGGRPSTVFRVNPELTAQWP